MILPPLAMTDDDKARAGIYLDNLASNAQIYGNFVQGTTFAGVYIHGGSGNQIYDNTLLDNGTFGISTVVADDFAMDGNEVYRNFIQVSVLYRSVASAA